MDFNGTFLVTIISFLVFVFLMNKLLYAPIRKIVNERTDFINGNYAEAENNNQKAEKLEQEHDEKIVEAKDEARVKYNELVDEYKVQRNNVIKETQQQANEELQEQYNLLNNVSGAAKESLKAKMTELANEIVEKLLGYRSEVGEFDNNSVDNILYH